MSWNSALYKRFFFFALTLAFTACGAKKGSFATTSETGSPNCVKQCLDEKEALFKLGSFSAG